MTHRSDRVARPSSKFHRLPVVALVVIAIAVLGCAPSPTPGLREVEGAIVGLELPAGASVDTVRTAYGCDEFEYTERSLSRIVTYDREILSTQADLSRQLAAAGWDEVDAPPLVDRFEKDVPGGRGHIEIHWPSSTGVKMLGGVDGERC